MFTYTDNEQLKKELKKCIIDNGYTAKMICDKLGMLCSLKGVDVLDCWGNLYDIIHRNFYFQELKFNAPEIFFSCN